MSQPGTPPQFIRPTSVIVTRPKRLASGELHIGPHKYKLICDDGKLRQEFQNVELSPETEVTLHYKRSSMFSNTKTQGINARHLFNSFSASQTSQDLSVTHDDIRVVFRCETDNPTSFAPETPETGLATTHAEGNLTPSTQTILADCPRFRILVIGKSGVGKSSLIYTAFGISKTHISDLERGKADIHEGLESPVNERFILHDSLGFEPGDKDNYKTVKDFIQSRRNGPLKDQLHAIWFCIPVPRAGGRLLETAAEDFFKTKKETMGAIPLIVVYTKLDMFVDDRTMQLATFQTRPDEKSLMKCACEEAETSVQKRHDEINRFAKGSLPHAVISTKKNYEHTFENLIQLTYHQVGIRDTPGAQITSVVTLMAQRVVPSLKIQGTIDVGKQRYWKAWRTGPNFKGHTIWDCLSVIHTDIVAVWNFNDPDCHLLENKFKEHIVEMVTKMEKCSVSNPNKILALGGGSLVAAVSGFLAAISNPAAPIVLPIIAGTVACVWLYKVYQNVKNVQKIFIAYIVDLTHIMEALFILTARNHNKLTRRAIKLAYSTYVSSGLMNQAHVNIQNYCDLGEDAALRMIESLIKPEKCGDMSMKNYHAEINKLDLGKARLDQEEDW